MVAAAAASSPTGASSASTPQIQPPSISWRWGLTPSSYQSRNALIASSAANWLSRATRYSGQRPGSKGMAPVRLRISAGASAYASISTIRPFRFLARALQAPDSAELRVEIAYPDSSKRVWEELARFDGAQSTAARGGWRLTSDLDMKPDLGGKTAGFRRVAFRFTALSGNWRLDDLYVDPRRR